MSTILSTYEIMTGHCSSQARHVVQAQSTSGWMMLETRSMGLYSGVFAFAAASAAAASTALPSSVAASSAGASIVLAGFTPSFRRVAARSMSSFSRA